MDAAKDCYAEMMSGNLTYDTGRMRDETDFMNPWKDITDEFTDKTPAELKASTCCQKNCHDDGGTIINLQLWFFARSTDWHLHSAGGLTMPFHPCSFRASVQMDTNHRSAAHAKPF